MIVAKTWPAKTAPAKTWLAMCSRRPACADAGGSSGGTGRPARL
jgi:hypothetical protein